MCGAKHPIPKDQNVAEVAIGMCVVSAMKGRRDKNSRTQFQGKRIIRVNPLQPQCIQKTKGARSSFVWSNRPESDAERHEELGKCVDPSCVKGVSTVGMYIFVMDLVRRIMRPMLTNVNEKLKSILQDAHANQIKETHNTVMLHLSWKSLECTQHREHAASESESRHDTE